MASTAAFTIGVSCSRIDGLMGRSSGEPEWLSSLNRAWPRPFKKIEIYQHLSCTAWTACPSFLQTAQTSAAHTCSCAASLESGSRISYSSWARTTSPDRMVAALQHMSAEKNLFPSTSLLGESMQEAGSCFNTYAKARSLACDADIREISCCWLALPQRGLLQG
eukprot:1139019-Pelagomonas_calceolata.AAC.9